MAESPDRPRDDTGRPRNARPRDITGAPLPPGTPTPWRERLAVQDREDSLPPDDALVEAERLILGGAPFYAHEVLEGPWHLAAEPERRFWQGLAQIAVGLTHVQRGNPGGAVVILRRAADNLDGYADGLHGVGTHRLVRTARELADRVEVAGATDVLSASDLELPLRR
ncbi:MAG TPA: DUF309 domain-containing protein [Mycobacteriales bacterium]|nr:DUF309 domain-containing protein [Mycobacteriales bacterium]